jgi:hypothetical protein
MVRMIPNSLDAIPTATAGERKLFDILKKQLPDDCIVRREMMVGMKDQKPDFTIIDPNRGVVIIEVKDWGVDHIGQAAQYQFQVRGFQGSSAYKPLLNPDHKCQLYVGQAREQLISMTSLRDARGHLNIPVYYWVAFPNITRAEFQVKGLGSVMPEGQVLLREDLPNTGTPFLSRYQKDLATLPAGLDATQLMEISYALFPDIVIPTVTQAGFYSTNTTDVHQDADAIEQYGLSLDQEEIAKSIGEGPRLLRGIAGTGKTLILLYRAKMLAANDPGQHILILCWNTALSTYMKQVYNKLEMPTRGIVEIMQVTELFRKLLNWRRDPECGWDDPSILPQLAEVVIPENRKYTAVYIDEAQDFRKEWISFIFSNLVKGEPKQRNLIIAADDAQRVYRQRNFSWSALMDIPMMGRSKILRTIYRNSARVWAFSAFMLKEKATYVRDPDAIGKLEFSTKGGYDPQLIECDSLDAQIDKTIDLVVRLMKNGFAAKNVLILYRHKIVSWLGHYPLVERLKQKLDEAGIPYDWIAEDAAAKREFRWDADTVKISTVHSAKGMDSPVVFILGAETFRQDKSDDTDEASLMYVGMTRAREFLALLHTGDQGLVNNLRYCQSEYMKYRDQLIAIEE